MTAPNAAAQSDKAKKRLMSEGSWVMIEDQTTRAYLACCAGGDGKGIPLTPKYRKIRDDFATLPFNSIEGTYGNLPNCITPGMPGLMEHPIQFEFLLTPGRVSLMFQEGTFRRIWTDGRKFPENLYPQPNGYSIGQWEGDTLVVETRFISKEAEIFISAPIHSTSQTRVTERFTVESDTVVKLETTIVDPELFEEPYTYPNEFVKVPISFETGCAANNKDDGNNFDLTPPDFD